MQQDGRRGELTDFGRKTEAEAIRDTLRKSHDGKWGFNIYRVDYSSDQNFSRFVELLTAHATVALDYDDTGEAVKHLLDWNVQDNKTDLNGATIGEVRR